jgi:hypothetical protein
VSLEAVGLIHHVYVWSEKKMRERRERIEMKELANIFPVSGLTQSPEAHADEPNLVKICSRIGLILVVVGVVAEWRCEAKLEDAHNAVHLYDLRKIEAAEKQAGDAAVSAKIAHDEAGAASIKARQAETDAGVALRTSKAANVAAFEAQGNVEEVTGQSAELSRKLWQTQYLMSARTLIDMNSLVETLKKFKGKEIVLSSFTGDPEAYSLCNAFVNVAFSAEMKPVDRCAKESPSPPFPAGLTGIVVLGPNDDEIKEFRDIVASAVTSGGAGGTRAQPGTTLTIRVGSLTPFIMDKNQFFNPPPIRRQTQRQNNKP